LKALCKVKTSFCTGENVKQFAAGPIKLFQIMERVERVQEGCWKI